MDEVDHPMLCDFGLACILHDEVTHAQTSSTTGTLVFTSPEHLCDKRDKMSDIWAFGCTAVTVRPLSHGAIVEIYGPLSAEDFI